MIDTIKLKIPITHVDFDDITLHQKVHTIVDYKGERSHKQCSLRFFYHNGQNIHLFALLNEKLPKHALYAEFSIPKLVYGHNVSLYYPEQILQLLEGIRTEMSECFKVKFAPVSEWVITSSPDKAETAKSYGATGVIITSLQEDMEKAAHEFDFLLDTIPKAHDLSPYLDLLSIHGTICLVGPIEPMPGFHSHYVINGQKSIAGSGIGGIRETQEMLEYSAEHNILPEIEVIKIQDINKAWESLKNKQMAKRYVIDMKMSFPKI